MSTRLALFLVSVSFAARTAFAQDAYNFDAVTQSALSAVAGENVSTAVPGFELLLMRDGQVVYNQAFGAWNLGRPVDADSATKTVSGAVIMSLTDSSPRPFSLNTRLSEYIPAFGVSKAEVTIRQAFTHTSGFQESLVLSDPDISLYEAAVDIADDPVWLPPDLAFIYGGTAMQAAGAVAEVASGQSWRDLFQQRIADPLGLTQTQYVYSGPENPRVGGGVRTTALEYGRFMEMLRSGGEYDGRQVLSENAVAQMFTRQSPELLYGIASPLNGSADVGVGTWLDERDADGNLLGAMTGGLRGFTSWIDFDDGLVGVLATDFSSFEVTKDLQYLLRDEVEAAVRAPTVEGDANGDGAVDADDLHVMLSNLGGRNRLWSQGDFNGDGAVNGIDYIAWASHQSVSAAIPIPEPSSMALLAFGALGSGWMLARQRARLK